MICPTCNGAKGDELNGLCSDCKGTGTVECSDCSLPATEQIEYLNGWDQIEVKPYCENHFNQLILKSEEEAYAYR